MILGYVNKYPRKTESEPRRELMFNVTVDL